MAVDSAYVTHIRDEFQRFVSVLRRRFSISYKEASYAYDSGGCDEDDTSDDYVFGSAHHRESLQVQRCADSREQPCTFVDEAAHAEIIVLYGRQAALQDIRRTTEILRNRRFQA